MYQSKKILNTYVTFITYLIILTRKFQHRQKQIKCFIVQLDTTPQMEHKTVWKLVNTTRNLVIHCSSKFLLITCTCIIQHQFLNRMKVVKELQKLYLPVHILIINTNVRFASWETLTKRIHNPILDLAMRTVMLHVHVHIYFLSLQMYMVN